MSEENELFSKDDHFRGLVKKARRHSVIRTVLISLLISIIVFFSIFWLNSFLMQKSIQKYSMDDSLWNYIHGANIESNGTSYNYNLLSAVGKTDFYKDIDGILVPWTPSERVFSIFGKSSLVTSSGASTGITLIGADRVPYFYNGERVIEFYHPKVNNENIVDDRKILTNIPEDKVIELAYSFDDNYTIEEVEKVFKDDMVWLWVNAYDEEEMRKDNEVIEEHDKRGHTIIGDSAFGFHYNSREPNGGAEYFISSLEQMKKKGSNKSSAEDLINRITNNDEKKLTPENLEIIGVVVTGSPKELMKYNDVPMIRAATLGVTVDKY
ncbi:anti sigma factor C-terminal domain-containing protein [Lederbergia citrea]|uniref:anti sigma factor C-terminal domain-containing protein n=1 Tax=Lederbergia citrea TaxID=2833581 RepID=UPI001BCA1AB4|nr:anti sigma factor C-terminal domain-containing protein [Lederbergia citrea]MBS4204648.1 anti sigma factor C-terminal domain-containing protein [Lederbergia citrea]